MILPLQAWRAIGAAMIFMHHYGACRPASEAFGDIIVDFFMMLSGYVLSAAYQKRDISHLPDMKSFISARMLKIYPLYFLSMLFCFLLDKFHTPLIVMGADLLMIQTWIPSRDFFFSGNSAAWFVCDIFFCYLFFLPAHKSLRSNPTRFICLFSSLLIVWGACALILGNDSLLLNCAIFYINPISQLIPFLAGMLLWHYKHLIFRPLLSVKKQHPFLPDMIFIASLILWIASILIYPRINSIISFSAFWWVPNALLILSLTLISHKENSWFGKILSMKWLVWCGNISFAFYILHVPWIRTYNIILGKSSLDINPTLSFFLCFLLLIPAAWVAEHYITLSPKKK